MRGKGCTISVVIRCCLLIVNLVPAYLKAGFSHHSNIIAVDWGMLSANKADILWPPVQIISKLPAYIAARINVPTVGKRLQEFISFLQSNGKISNPDNVHLVGHSLGAHVSGMAGMYYHQNTTSLLGRISGQ